MLNFIIVILKCLMWTAVAFVVLVFCYALLLKALELTLLFLQLSFIIPMTIGSVLKSTLPVWSECPKWRRIVFLPLYPLSGLSSLVHVYDQLDIWRETIAIKLSPPPIQRSLEWNE
jgi:hypothetical protein